MAVEKGLKRASLLQHEMRPMSALGQKRTLLSALPPIADKLRGSRFVRKVPIATSPLHSITSSARARGDGGRVRPKALAIFRFIKRSNVTGCCTGRSPGLAPLRIL